MFCDECGARIADGSKFCTNCGFRFDIDENIDIPDEPAMNQSMGQAPPPQQGQYMAQNGMQPPPQFQQEQYMGQGGSQIPPQQGGPGYGGQYGQLYNQPPQKSGSPIMIIIIIAVVFLLIVGIAAGAFFFIKKGKGKGSDPTEEFSTEVSSTEQSESSDEDKFDKDDNDDDDEDDDDDYDDDDDNDDDEDYGSNGDDIIGIVEDTDIKDTRTGKPSRTAISGGEWEQLQSGEYIYYDKNGKQVSNTWAEDEGQYFYVGPDGCLVYNNYAPDGYWADEYGAWDSYASRYELQYEPYNQDYIGDLWTFEIYMDDAYSGTAKFYYSGSLGGSNPKKRGLKIERLGISSYAAYSVDNENEVYLLTVVDEGNSLIVSSDGQTEICTIQ